MVFLSAGVFSAIPLAKAQTQGIAAHNAVDNPKLIGDQAHSPVDKL